MAHTADFKQMIKLMEAEGYVPSRKVQDLLLETGKCAALVDVIKEALNISDADLMQVMPTLTEKLRDVAERLKGKENGSENRN